MCASCHGYKTNHEPREAWEPQFDRLVVCGLPGTGKTTFAKSQGVSYFDSDERPELTNPAAIVAARDRWIEEHNGACVVIVASIVSASNIAERIRGVVQHMTERFVERAPRPPISAAF